MLPAVFCSSSLVASTFWEDATRVSNVTALFCVVSDRCRDMANIFSVTSFSCDTRLPRLCLAPVLLRCLRSLSPVIAISSSRLAFSISNMVETFALRNACSVFENCSRCVSTSVASAGSPISRAKSSNRSIFLRIADNLARPASFSSSSSPMDDRLLSMSWNRANNLIHLPLLRTNAPHLYYRLGLQIVVDQILPYGLECKFILVHDNCKYIDVSFPLWTCEILFWCDVWRQIDNSSTCLSTLKINSINCGSWTTYLFFFFCYRAAQSSGPD